MNTMNEKMSATDIKENMKKNPIMFAKLCADDYRIIEDVVIIRINDYVYITALNSDVVSSIYIESAIHYAEHESFDITVKELFTITDWTPHKIELLKNATLTKNQP
jgi:hypothetical protein